MRRAFLTLAAALIAGLALATASVAAPAARTVPDALAVPDGQRVVLKTIGVGVQVYDCLDGSWRFREPAATLGRGRSALGIHFAGPNWQSLRDGSRVTGRLRTGVAAPRPGRDIPWLLLEAAANVGSGVFADVDFVQRLDTRGGVAPPGACDPVTRPSVAVPYRSTYVFWAPVATR